MQTMPHSTDFEKALLASCLLYPDDRATITDKLKPSDFYTTPNRIIFQAIVSLEAKGLAPELEILVDEIKRQGKDVDLAYLSSIFDREPVAVNVSHYIEKVRDLALKRRLAELGNAIFKKALAGDDLSGNDVSDFALQSLIDLGAASNGTMNMPVSEVIQSIVADLSDNASAAGKVPGTKTGFFDLDSLTGGLRPGQLWVIAARPGLGKSALAGNIAVNVAMQGVRVQIFSMEMSAEQLAMRWLAAKSKLSLKRLEHYKVQAHEWKQIHEAAEKIYKLGIDIYDRGGLSNVELARLCRQFKAQNNTGLIIVDYLQLAHGQHPKNKVQDTGDVSRTLKEIAMNLKIPVIGLSQLNREAEKVERPGLRHLRESGNIEQDADVVVMLSNTDDPTLKFIDVLKQRQGPRGNLRLYWSGELTSFFNLHEQ